jgi:hypothetical protein
MMFVLICTPNDDYDKIIFCGIFSSEKIARERLDYICKNVDLTLKEEDFLLFNSNLNENIFQYDNDHSAGRLI